MEKGIAGPFDQTEQVNSDGLAGFRLEIAIEIASLPNREDMLPVAPGSTAESPDRLHTQ